MKDMEHTRRITVPMTPELFDAIESYRFNTRAKNQAAAVRELIERGLRAAAGDAGAAVGSSGKARGKAKG